MTDAGHVARARALGIAANRTLIRDAVNLMLRSPGAPCFIVYRGHRLSVTAARPAFGAWRKLGPYPPGVTVQALADEIGYLARDVRESGRAATV